MPLFSFDTETFLISPGANAPRLVCFQFGLDNGPESLLHGRYDRDRIHELATWALKHALINGHSVAFDMCVLAANFPDLLPLIFAAYDADRITCTAVRAKLFDISRGRFEGGNFGKHGYSLRECLARVLGLPAEMKSSINDDPEAWRYRYGELYGTPLADWPEAPKVYALRDVTEQRQLFLAQESEYGPDVLADQFRQSRADFMLTLVSFWGIRTDLEYVKRYHAQALASSAADRVIAERAGLIKPDGVRHMAKAMARMVDVFRELGEQPTLTDTGLAIRDGLAAEGLPAEPLDVYAHALAQSTKSPPEGAYISLDEDSCLASGDEILEAFQRFGSLKTRLKRIERLYYGTELPLQSRFQSIVETGRTSCRMGDVKDGQSPPSWGFQLQNLPTKD